MNIEKEMQKYRDMGFDEYQLDQIEKGLKKGLDITIYAKLEFNKAQMWSIRFALEENVPREIIELIANPNFCHEQMEVIKTAGKCKMPLNEIKIFAKPEYNSSQMEYLILGIQRDYDVSIYENPNLSYMQMGQIFFGFEAGLSLEKIQLYAKPEFNEYQMHEIKLGFEHGLLMDEVKTYANSEYSDKYMFLLRMSLEYDIDINSCKILDWNKIENLKKNEIENIYNYLIKRKKANIRG